MERYYQNTNAALYKDIALWEKTEGIKLMAGMPLEDKENPKILDLGFGFGHYLMAAAYAYPNGKIYGIDGDPICMKEVGNRVKEAGLTHVKLIGEKAENLKWFEDESLNLVLLYDMLHASYANKKMYLEEAHRVLKQGGCLSVLPFHQSNWRDAEERKKKYSPAKIRQEITEYGFEYNGTCEVKGIHWEKCHTLYYIQKGTITFDVLERMDVMNFRKKSI